MYHPTSSENWLRKDCRFFPYLNSDAEEGACFNLEISPSQFAPMQIQKMPATIIIRGITGRGEITLETGERYTIGCASIVRVPANTRFWMRNELRDIWTTYVTVLGQTCCESFIETIGMTKDENLLVENAAACGIELYIPEPEPQPVAAITEATQRITYPMTLGFSL